MKSYNHRIRTLTEQEAANCCRSGCENAAVFECGYEWRGGWNLEQENTARLPLCTKHALGFVEKFKIRDGGGGMKDETEKNPPLIPPSNGGRSEQTGTIYRAPTRE